MNWYPWGEEAFEKARNEDRPVFLSTGAIWCHWCHVMAKESFENEETARFLNENFISIKLDRDERPDVDRIYQKAVQAMGSGGGWPLSVFLTPDKKPFFGGTYFPPKDDHGVPGFGTVLKKVAAFYRSKQDEISGYIGRLLDALRQGPLQPEALSGTAVEKAVADVLSQFDPQNGGFGASPKFPMPGAMEFLLNRYFFTRNESLGFAIRKTLLAMAKGGFHDQLGGGFHRYSTDEAWLVPHFEKMANDNAWLLRNYLNAYAIFGDEYFRTTAEGIIRFIHDVLSDPRGGFYASQDADVTPEDEGGYFTWTESDLRRELTAEEYMALSLHLFHEKGAMHHDRSKRVLFVAMEPDEIAVRTSMDPGKVTELINSGKEKLGRERLSREIPQTDKALYASLNGILITSYLLAFRRFGTAWIKDRALKSLDRIMALRFRDNTLFHADGVKAGLEDYIFLVEALIAAYETTADPSYLSTAESLMGLCIEKLWDDEEGGFFEAEEAALGIRLKAVEDIPHPSANAVGITLLLKLYFITGRALYRAYAEKALKIFSGTASGMGIHAGCYDSALDAWFNMIRLTVHADPGSGLSAAALSAFRPYVTLVYGEDRGYVLPCVHGSCYDPIETPEGLKEFLTGRR